MPADRLLGTLLRSLQPYSDQQDVSRLLGTAASLLTSLNNPLNVVLLTSQLLSAPAIWTRPNLQTSLKGMSVFHSAAQALVRHQHATEAKSPDRDFAALQLERALPQDEWIRAVVKGADEHSPRWRHVLVLGGLLLGFGPREDDNLSRAMRSTLEKSFTNAVNLACTETPNDDLLGLQTIAAVLNHCFPTLSSHEQHQLDFDQLLPVLMQSSFRAQDGIASPTLLRAINDEAVLSPQGRLQWSMRSQSYQHVKSLLANPLVSSLGALARLIGHGIEQVRSPSIVMSVLDDLDEFCRVLHLQWRQNKLSSVEYGDENTLLEAETAFTTFPALWKIFRGIMFASVLILRAIIGKLLGDKVLSRSTVATDIAIQSLRILRHTYFISARSGPSTFSQHKFVHLSAIDIMATHPLSARDLLYSIRPAEIGRIPQHPLDRNFDLFFFNTAEYLTPITDPQMAEQLIVASASAYITSTGSSTMLPIFEAAHSTMLATFAAPQNAEVANVHLPFYVGALFNVFPASLSVRQFRYAYLALLQITTPPSRLAAKQPMLSSTLLELLRERAERANTAPLPTHILGSTAEPPRTVPEMPPEPPAAFSEQSVLVMTMIDTLTQLPLDLLGEWLPIAADMVSMIDDPFMREECKQHFWHTLSNGDMDPERSRVCHAWWSTAGGRDAVLYGREYADSQRVTAEMSGALPDGEGSKL